jgi:DNA helicase TIP49 (TBP-interacting protein)
MDYETFALRNIAYLQDNFPKRTLLKYRRHPLKAMYLQERIEKMLDTFVDVYQLILDEERFESLTSLTFVRMVEYAMELVLRVSSMLYSSDQSTTDFFEHKKIKIMIEGFCGLVEAILTKKYYGVMC